MAVLLPPVLLRLRLLLDTGAAIGPADAAGWLADLGVSGLVLAVVLVCLRAGSWLGLAAVTAWIAANLVSYESIRALDALPSFRDASYLADPTFVAGSGLGALSGGIAPWTLGGALVFAWLGRRAKAGPRTVLWTLAAGALLLGLHARLAWRPDLADWRQTHALLQNVVDAAEVPPAPPQTPDLETVTADLAANLDGAPTIGTRPGAANVLLVLIESMSGAYLPSLAAAHGREAAPSSMPRLDAFARRHLAFPTFVVHQVNTNRGLYAALCGDLPKLLPGTPKMSAHAARGIDTCLPALLRDAGYHTAYLQAAPLAFMLKDQFMPRIGFEEVFGAGSFETARARSAWGVDDGTLLERGVELVSQLRRAGGPWFATMLTVGTHHPYLVPPGFEPRTDDDFERAVAYADFEVARFLDALEAMGVLEDTLVLVTSDESRGLRGAGDPLSHVVSQGWGLLVAAGPGIDPGLVSTPFALSDLPLSVLDYLSLGETGQRAGLLGRSVFRAPARPRYVFFGNTRRDAVGAIDPQGRLLLCRRHFRSCEAFRMPDGAFAARRVPIPWAPDRGGILAAAARWSLTSGPPPEATASIELMADHRVPLDQDETRLLHGGQNVELRAGQWLEVELSLQVEGDNEVELEHILRDPLHVHLDQKRRIPAGGEYHLVYTFVPGKPVDKIQCMSTARPLDGVRPGAALDFSVARMHVRSTGERPPPGLHFLRDDVVPRGESSSPTGLDPRLPAAQVHRPAL